MSRVMAALDLFHFGHLTTRQLVDPFHDPGELPPKMTTFVDVRDPMFECATPVMS
jgi:hypothetical protein